MNLSQIIKQLQNKDDLLILNPEEKESLLIYIKELEKIIEIMDKEIKWI